MGPHLLLDAELIVYLVLALLYLLPWYCFVNMRCWKYLFALLVVFSVAFVFIQVFDLMFQYMLAAGMGQKSAPAAFQSLLVFLCLLQVPVALFLRRPELLD